MKPATRENGTRSGTFFTRVLSIRYNGRGRLAGTSLRGEKRVNRGAISRKVMAGHVPGLCRGSTSLVSLFIFRIILKTSRVRIILINKILKNTVRFQNIEDKNRRSKLDVLRNIIVNKNCKLKYKGQYRDTHFVFVIKSFSMSFIQSKFLEIDEN